MFYCAKEKTLSLPFLSRWSNRELLMPMFWVVVGKPSTACRHGCGGGGALFMVQALNRNELSACICNGVCREHVESKCQLHHKCMAMHVRAEEGV